MNRILIALLCALLLLALCACEAEKITQEPESPQEEPLDEEEIPGYSILEGLPTIVLPEIGTSFTVVVVPTSGFVV